MNAASSVEVVEYAYMSLKIFVINWKIDLEETGPDECFRQLSPFKANPKLFLFLYWTYDDTYG